MAANAQANVTELYARRTRSVWTVLAVCMAVFCVICVWGGASLYGYLSSVTRPGHAKMQLVRGKQLTVVRHGRLDREAVQIETSLSEGDSVMTGPDTEANIDFFDGSTALLSFNTSIKLDALHTSRFFGDNKELAFDVDSGTLLFSTADKAAYSSVRYKASTNQAEINVEPNSTARIDIVGGEGAQTTEAAVSVGSAEVVSGGKTVGLKPGYKTFAAANSPPAEPQPDEVQLIRNGNFTQPPTSRAEGAETGLNTAAWTPIIEQAGGDPASVSVVTVTTEYVGNQSVRAAKIDRQGEGERYAKIGLQQDINKSASYFHLIELKANVKVVAQTELVGGPQENVFPLTIRVLYKDSNDQQREWKESFYYCPTAKEDCAHERAEAVPLGQYVPGTFVIKRIGGGGGASSGTEATAAPDVGQDISVIDSIEIYGLGSQFQSWITDISLTAR